MLKTAARPRRWEEVFEDDPLTSLVNLTDVWIVLAVSMLLAVVTYCKLPSLLDSNAASQAQSQQAPSVESIPKRTLPLERYRMTANEMGGEGVRLGMAYRLATGEVVYVPEGAAEAAGSPQRRGAPAGSEGSGQ